MMAKQIKTSINIKATPQEVWNVLMDFENYPTWNSFITTISGKAKEEEKLKVELQGMQFTPKVIKVDKNSEFRWLGHFLIKGIFDGEHVFKLTKNIDGTTTFEQSENFKGILIPFVPKTLQKTKLGFEKMNRELKNRVEAG